MGTSPCQAPQPDSSLEAPGWPMGKATCTLTWGAQESPAQGPRTDASRASSQPAPLSRSPGLSQSPRFPPIPCPVGRRLVHHASITQSWAPTRGHPLNCGYLLATRCRRAWGPPAAPVAYLYCLLLDCPPRSLQVLPYLSVQGPSFTHKP